MKFEKTNRRIMEYSYLNKQVNSNSTQYCNVCNVM